MGRLRALSGRGKRDERYLLQVLRSEDGKTGVVPKIAANLAPADGDLVNVQPRIRARHCVNRRVAGHLANNKMDRRYLGASQEAPGHICGVAGDSGEMCRRSYRGDDDSLMRPPRRTFPSAPGSG